MRTVLVTGGAGFIGSHLCARLAGEGDRVISLDNYSAGSRANHVDGVNYREGHTKDIARLIPERPDLIYHLGEYSRVERSFEDVARVWDQNQAGTLAVLEFARQSGAKLVYAGSSTKFADGGLGRDQSPYAWSKASMTELVANYGRWFGLRYAVTYFYNVYGGREAFGPMGTVVAIFKDRYLKGLPLHVTAPGTQERIFTHVEDTVDALLMVGERGEGNDFGIGSEERMSILDLARLFGCEVVLRPERRGNRQSAFLDASKTRALGWEPKRSLREDIAGFLERHARKSAA